MGMNFYTGKNRIGDGMSYSGFNHLRRCVAHTFGYDWDRLTQPDCPQMQDDLKYLLEQSDCDATLSVKEARLLLLRLSDVQIDFSLGGMDKKMQDFYQEQYNVMKIGLSVCTTKRKIFKWN